VPLIQVAREAAPGALRVLFLLADQFGCGWYRCMMPGIYLRNLYGVDARAATSLTHAVRDFARHADILVFQRQLDEHVLDFLHEHKSMGKKIVVEIDDDFWHLPLKNPAYRYYQAGGLTKLARFIRAADLVTVSTDPLKHVVETIHDRVVVLPNAVDPDIVEALEGARQCQPTVRAGIVRIGWAGTMFHQQDFDCVVDALIQVAKHRHVKLVFFGWVPERIEREVLPEKLEKHPFVPTNTYYHALAGLRLDIGIAPLHDNRFNEAKSNLKFLEYSMFKIPTVASPVLPYQKTITPGVDGILVKKNRHQEWLRQLTRLVEDKVERERIAANALSTVKQRFHLKSTVRLWLDVYEALAPRAGRRSQSTVKSTLENGHREA
jgi:glycosyltransferase involved in cell wall biosynthesis